MQNVKRKKPDESDSTYEDLNKWVRDGMERMKKFHQRCKHNRAVVAGFDWKKPVDSGAFIKHRANLIHSTIQVLLPVGYARNPEVSVTPRSGAQSRQVFCKTLEQALNAQMEESRLKAVFKRAVRSAMTCSIGIVKVSWQQEFGNDPEIYARMSDVQDNIAKVDALIAEMSDQDVGYEDQVRSRNELNDMLLGLQEKSEVVVAEGLALDVVMPEHLLLDESIHDFWDYPQSPKIAQLIPMSKRDAEAKFGIELDCANGVGVNDVWDYPKPFLGSSTDEKKEDKVWLVELWDREKNLVYTFGLGCHYAARAPYRPSAVGERWYPYFIVPFQTVDGQLIGPSIVDLTEKLQEEHNAARDDFNNHRQHLKPGFFASKTIKPSTLQNLVDDLKTSEGLPITLFETDGQPLDGVIRPRPMPTLNPMAYSTEAVRIDWELVTGAQDAARGVVTAPKTATEASIMAQNSSARSSEFNDQIEEVLTDIYRYAAELMLQQYTASQVLALTGLSAEEIDWPQALEPAQSFSMVNVSIRAGSTVQPNKVELQEKWIKLLPLISPLIVQINQLNAQGLENEAAPFLELLKETCARFDDSLDPMRFVSKKSTSAPPVVSALPEAAPALDSQAPVASV